MIQKLRCILCDEWINQNDLLKHGIQKHNSKMAKFIQEKLNDLNRDAKELGLPQMQVNDILSDVDILKRLDANWKEKEKLR